MSNKIIQESCEIIEKLLERDLTTNDQVLKEAEFLAATNLLMELNLLGLYKVKINPFK